MKAFKVFVTSPVQKDCLDGLALTIECYGRNFAKEKNHHLDTLS